MMAIVEPLDILSNFPGWTIGFDLHWRQEQSVQASGRILIKDMGAPLWTLRATSKTLSPNSLDNWRARLTALENGLVTFWGYPMSRLYPILYPNGSWPSGLAFSGTTAVLSSIAANRKTIGLSSLPAGYTLSAGDYISIVMASSPARRDLHQVMEAATAGGGVPAMTFNPADKSAVVTLSGGDLVATVNSSIGGVRGTRGVSSGKYYWESTYTTINTNAIYVGLALATSVLDQSNGLGIAFVGRTTGAINVNGVASGSALGGPIAAASVIGIAVDLAAKLIWFRIAPAGQWNGSGTADPATGVGGVNIASISSGLLYPIFSGQTLDKVTANYGASGFSGSVPSGFSAGFPATPAGSIDSFEVRPQLWPDVVTGKSIWVKQPACLMALVPGSVHSDAQINGWGSVSFSAIEARL